MHWQGLTRQGGYMHADRFDMTRGDHSERLSEAGKRSSNADFCRHPIAHGSVPLLALVPHPQ